MVVFTFAQAGAAKVEAQYRKTKFMQRLHCVVDDLIVHGPAMQRMWMANQGAVRCVQTAFIQQRLQPACRPIQKK